MVSDGVLQRLRNALDSPDVDALFELLAPNATWGAPGDPNPSCNGRGQVMAWYQRSFALGVRRAVGEVAVIGDNILVGLTVTATPAGEPDRSI